MVYTRSQKSEFVAAARNLLSLKAPVTSTLKTAPVSSSSPSTTRFWQTWSTWYHAFLSEVTDESPSLPIASRRSEATSRWVTFCAKELRCSESVVRAWLRTADQKALVAAYA